MYSAGQTGVLKLTVAGSTWKQMPVTAYSFAVAVDSNAPETVYASSTAGLAKSTDAGATWKKLTTAPKGYIYGLFVDSKSVIYAAAKTGPLVAGNGGKTYNPAAAGLWSSTDGGSTWTSLGTPSGVSVNAVARDNATGYLYAGFGGLGVGSMKTSK
jgi:hypothetical protein